jgi:hypothetical protein
MMANYHDVLAGKSLMACLDKNYGISSRIGVPAIIASTASNVSP